MENNPSEFSSRIDLSSLQQSVEALKAEFSRYIIGQPKMLDLLLVSLLADGHALLEGVPGVAKTRSARLMAQLLDVDYSRIQFTPDLMPSDILGTAVYNQKSSEFEYQKGPIFANIVLIDEINRAPAKTQAALFEVMEERQVTADGQTYAMELPYLVLATQNPVEQEGTYRLPEAQLDRFLMKISVDYPTLEEEQQILDLHNKRQFLNIEEAPRLLTAQQILDIRKLVQQVQLSPEVRNYIAQLVHQTRSDSNLYLGASPRASVALLTAGKAFAALHGRDFVSPEDVQFLWQPVLGHRVILAPEREMEGLSTEQALQQVLTKVEVPR
jgi:MoxR-like ATPase